MSWRGQGRRARSRRADQEPDNDNTAWLAELEKAAVEQDDQEEEWASKLRRRRSQEPGPAWPAAGEPQPPPAPPPAEPPRSPPSGLPRAPVNHDLSPYPPLGGEPLEPPPPARPGPAREPDYGLLGMEPDARDPGGDWDTGGWAPEPPPRSSGRWAPEEPPPRPAGGWDPGPAARSPGPAAEPAPEWPRPAARSPGAAEPAPEWPRPAAPSPGPAEPAAPEWPRWDLEAEATGGAPADYGLAPDARGRAPADHGEGPWNGTSAGHDLGERDWRPAGPDTPTGAWSPEPTGREPDYPALFGELNRRSAAQRDPLWDSPPAAEPYEEPAAYDPPAPAWPFEETTQTWEPSDRSFVWPAEELPTTTGEWEPSGWLDEPTPPPATAPPAAPPPAWPAAGAGAAAPGVPPAPGMPPPAPPDDWADGIQAGVPPQARGGWGGDQATRSWRPDEAVEAEPAVPLDAAGLPLSGPAPQRFDMPEPAESWELEDRPHRSWPKVVAIVSWIVLLMVVCWFYVFPWLEGVLPENF